jgi:hypothetical protein
MMFILVTIMVLAFLLAVIAVGTGYFQLVVPFAVVFVACWVVIKLRESRRDAKRERAYQRWLADPNVPVEKKNYEMERRREARRFIGWDGPS